MAIVRENVWTGVNSAGGTTLTITTTGSVSGRLLIAVVTKDDDDAITATGWTLVSGASGAITNSHRNNVYWRVGAGETSFSFTGDSEQWAGTIIELTGADTATPENDSTVSSAASATPNVATLTPSVDGCYILTGFGCDDDDTPFTLDSYVTSLPSPHPNHISNTGNGTCGQSLGDKIQTTAEATGALTHGMAASEGWTAFTLAVNPTNDIIIDTNLSSLSITTNVATISLNVDIPTNLLELAITTNTAAIAGSISAFVYQIDKLLLLEPALRIPHKQPLGPVKIDWRNTITKGLAFCYVVRGRTAYDLVGKRVGLVDTPLELPIEVDSDGQYVNFRDATDVSVYFSDWNRNVTPTSGFTFWGRYKWDSTTTTSVGGNVIALGGDTFMQLTMSLPYNADTGHWLSFNYVNGTAQFTTLTAIDQEIVNISVSSNNSDDTNLDGYKNGKLEVIGSIDYTGQNWTSGAVTIGKNDVAHNAHGNWYAGYIFARQLSHEEQLSLNADPYQFLIPA